MGPPKVQAAPMQNNRRDVDPGLTPGWRYGFARWSSAVWLCPAKGEWARESGKGDESGWGWAVMAGSQWWT